MDETKKELRKCREDLDIAYMKLAKCSASLIQETKLNHTLSGIIRVGVHGMCAACLCNECASSHYEVICKEASKNTSPVTPVIPKNSNEGMKCRLDT